MIKKPAAQMDRRVVQVCKLADADVNRTPCPDTWSDVHPRPGRAVIKADQEHQLAVEETAEVEVPPVFEKVAANDPAMPEIVVVVAIFAKFVVVAIFAKFIVVAVVIFVVQVSITAVLIVERAALRSLVVTGELAARAVQARVPTKARWSRWPT